MGDSIPLRDISPTSRQSYMKMNDPASKSNSSLGGTAVSRFQKNRDRSWTASLIGSYVFDWVVLLAVAAVGGVLALIPGHKRPFSLLDPNIAFPFTEHETVPIPPLLVATIVGPAVIILIICFVFVPGGTVPKGTPKGLIWKRKLWEFHVGLLGLALSIIAAWFVTNGMKNLFGRPRPDMLSRCEPDLANFRDYIVGGVAREDVPDELSQVLSVGMLVSADICKSTDKSKLDDGFRSYPSGHSSSAAAGLIYLSLFIASKFAVALPFAADPGGAASHAAFPSRLKKHRQQNGADASLMANDAGENKILAEHHRNVTAMRRQAAAPPIYLLCIALVPWFTSIFIAGSRWWDFRHHAFDIMFGYLIGVFSSIFAFYYYHLPIRQGAGWAWGPRSNDKAWWAGVGTYSYATDRNDHLRPGDEEEAILTGPNNYGGGASSTQMSAKEGADGIEMQRRGNNPASSNGNLSQSAIGQAVGHDVDERDYHGLAGPADTSYRSAGQQQENAFHAYGGSRTDGVSPYEDTGYSNRI